MDRSSARIAIRSNTVRVQGPRVQSIAAAQAFPILLRNARHLNGLCAFLTWMKFPSPNMNDRIVAVGLLTGRDLGMLGPAFDRAWPVEETPTFNELLSAIDEADLKLQQPPTPTR